jgi:hypothetical protein
MNWKNEVGIGHTPAYQVSGRPFATASVIYNSNVTTVNFPYVTRWFQVINKGESTVRIGFSTAGVSHNGVTKNGCPGSEGLSDAYYITLGPSGSSGYFRSDIYEMKISTLYLKDEGTAGTLDVLAGLTTIPTQRTQDNFTGSTGV